MTELIIEGLCASVDGSDILTGVDLVIRSGEVHAVMGPNGSGKSTLAHVLMGRPGYQVTGGSVTLDGVDILAMPTWQRAQAGLFLAMQYPVEVPGVSLLDMLSAVAAAGDRPFDDMAQQLRDQAATIDFDEKFLERPLNVDLSGGEQKRNETLQLGVLRPRIAILDELDSGLDVDGLGIISRRIEAATNTDDLGVLVITHYSRLLEQLRPDHVHVLVGGRIRFSGGPELADQLEDDGYAAYLPANAASPSVAVDPFADPFADPLA